MTFTLKDIVDATHDLGLRVVGEQDIAELVASGDLGRASRLLSKTHSTKNTKISATANAQREAAKSEAERERKAQAERERKAKAQAERERKAKAQAERERKAQAERERKAQAERERKEAQAEREEAAKRAADANAAEREREEAKAKTKAEKEEAKAKTKAKAEKEEAQAKAKAKAKAEKEEAQAERQRQNKIDEEIRQDPVRQNAIKAIVPDEFKKCMQTKKTMDTVFEKTRDKQMNQAMILNVLNEKKVELPNYLEYLNVQVRLGHSEEQARQAEQQKATLLTAERHTIKSTVRLDGIGRSPYNICFESVALNDATCTGEQVVSKYILHAEEILNQLIDNGSIVKADKATFVSQPACENCPEMKSFNDAINRLHPCPIRGDGFCGYSIILWALNVLYSGEKKITFDSFFERIDNTNNNALIDLVKSMALPETITTVEEYFRDNCRTLPSEHWLNDELLTLISEVYYLTIVVVVSNRPAQQPATTHLEIYGKANLEIHEQRIIYLVMTGTSHFDLLVPQA